MSHPRPAGGACKLTETGPSPTRAPSSSPPLRIALRALALLGVGAGPAFAIPSPDLVISVGASLSQVLGLLAVVGGGIAFSRRRRVLSRDARGTSPWPFRAVLSLLLVTLAGFGLYYSRTQDAKTERLRTNLFRTSREDGRQVGDVTLKTLSFSEQTKHPRAIGTDEFAAWIAEGRPLNLIDVREPEEVERGQIAGTWHRRYPDLQANRNGLVAPGRETVLICYSGNRSSELADEFGEDGVPCRFVIGGYEKWIAEGRPLEHVPSLRADIREIADYPNKEVLLDTPEFRDLVEEQEALILDVRYPKEFEQDHIKGAINLPIRRMLSEELAAAVEALPRTRPVVVTCYDKRGSFYSLILGLRLHRAGFDYRGRYTVPHEYFVPKGDRAYVDAWRRSNENPGLAGALTTSLAELLAGVGSALGHLLYAVLAAVLLLRFLLLPLTLKSERDQQVQRGLKARFREIRRAAGTDRRRASAAILALQREHGVTPTRNLLGSMAQVLVFLLLFAAVDAAAALAPASFLWMPSLAEADPFRILPVLVSGLFALHLLLGQGRPSRRRMLAAAAVMAALLALTVELRAAVNVYLAVNVGCVLLHAAFVRSRLAAAARAAAEARVVALDRAHEAAGAGNKAARLGRMLAAKLPVPGGFVLTAAALPESPGAPLAPEVQALVVRAWRRLGARRVAVRSSGLREDGNERSFAGVFESVLGVDRAGLFPAIGEVIRSLASERAASYGGAGAEAGGIVVQELVDAEYAGVLFTEHPEDGGAALVELVDGFGDALVSGRATPRTFAFGRASGRLLSEEAPPIDLEPLLALGARLEALFGCPQDVEWAYARGRFHLLQARDITARVANGLADSLCRDEQRRLLDLVKKGDGGEVVFAQNELTELLPAPTPLSLALMESLWAGGGSVERACRRLGVPYRAGAGAAPYLVGVFGRLCVSRREERRRAFGSVGFLAAFRFGRNADAFEREYRTEVLPAFLREARRRAAVDLGALADPDLLLTFRDWRDRFVTETYADVECINVLAEFYLRTAERSLRRRGLDPAEHLARMPRTVVQDAMDALADLRDGRFGHREFKRIFGHRAPLDFELAEPRYREDPELVHRLATTAKARPHDAADGAPLPGRRLLRMEVERACRFQALKEEAKHHALLDVATLRAVLVEIGKRFDLGDGVFQLTPDEVLRLEEPSWRTGAAGVIERRREAARAFAKVAVPTEVTVAWLERAARPGHEPASPSRPATALSGTKVAGSGDVVGRVRVLTDAAAISTFREREILVARFTDPTWTPVFPIAAGIVTEVGGWLSHAAIQARECGITGIVGVKGALSSLKTGDLVRLGRDGAIHRMGERRAMPRGGCRFPVSIEVDGRRVNAVLVEIGPGGFTLTDFHLDLPPGKGVRLRIPACEAPLAGALVHGTAGRAGFELVGAVPQELLSAMVAAS